MKSRDQRSGSSGQAGMRIFEVPECFGCGEPTLSRYRNLPLCVQCEQECTLLNTLYALPSEPEPEPAARESAVGQFRRVGRFVAKWLWVPNLVFVGGALLYLGAAFGYALLQWLGMVN